MNSYVFEMMQQFRNEELKKVNKDAWKWADLKLGVNKLKKAAKKKK